MERFAQKFKAARLRAHLLQEELGAQVGLSRHSISAYENGTALPRRSILSKLAEVLSVTEEYLRNDEIDNPESGRAQEQTRKDAYSRLSDESRVDLEKLMEKNLAFLAGGDVPQADKDAFFEVVMSAYVVAKEKAREKLARKPNGNE